MALRVIKAKNKIELVPVQFSCDKSLGDIPAPLPSENFFAYITGRPASGKSTLSSNLLTKKDLYKKRFDNLHLIIPNNSLASLPKTHAFRKHIEAEPENYYSDLTGEILHKILKKCQEASKEDETSLIFIDDMLHALKNPEVLDILKFVASNRRHIKTSCILISQIWNSLPVVVRKQISHAFVFRASKKEFNNLYEEQFTGLNKDDAEKICEYAWAKPHGFLFINCMENKYYDKDFDQLIIE